MDMDFYRTKGRNMHMHSHYISCAYTVHIKILLYTFLSMTGSNVSVCDGMGMHQHDMGDLSLC